MAERLICNQNVIGSTPISGFYGEIMNEIKFSEEIKWSKVLKSLSLSALSDCVIVKRDCPTADGGTGGNSDECVPIYRVTTMATTVKKTGNAQVTMSFCGSGGSGDGGGSGGSGGSGGGCSGPPDRGSEVTVIRYTNCSDGGGGDGDGGGGGTCVKAGTNC